MTRETAKEFINIKMEKSMKETTKKVLDKAREL